MTRENSFVGKNFPRFIALVILVLYFFRVMRFRVLLNLFCEISEKKHYRYYYYSKIVFLTFEFIITSIFLHKKHSKK